MWQAEADRELTLSASPATAVGQLTLTLANWRIVLVRNAILIPLMMQIDVLKLYTHLLVISYRAFGWMLSAHIAVEIKR